MRRGGCADRPLSNADPCRPQEKLLGHFIIFVDDPAACPRELDGAIDDGGEHRMQVQRGANRLTDLAQSSEFFNRTRQLTSPCLQLLEQSNGLNGDHRLVGEGCDQLDLLVVEELDFSPPDHDYSNEGALSEHGNSQDRSETSPRLDFQVLQLVFKISQDIWDLNHLALKGDPPDDSASPRADWVSLKEIFQLGGDVVGDRKPE